MSLARHMVAETAVFVKVNQFVNVKTPSPYKSRFRTKVCLIFSGLYL